MRVLIFDPFHGAAGDMITGALLDCGADRDVVMRSMAAVVAEPMITSVTRAGICATRVDIKATPAHRTLADVMKHLDTAAPHIPVPALAMARRVFERINAAETEVHGHHVHFHEVGADDAIADVVGACTALYSLAVDGVKVLTVTLGHGTATGSHGVFPIPAPATAAILKGTGLVATPGDHAGELCTPTGAALLAEFSMLDPGTVGEYTILATGYGAGSRDTRYAPNVLRVMLVETMSTGDEQSQDTVDLLETNVDDVSGEVIACALARFMEAGARDAVAVPIVMKKGRPGFLIRVISLPEMSAQLAELMALDLGTLGIRCIPAVHRFIADRTVVEVDVVIGNQSRKMPVKFGWMHGKMYLLKAEFGPAETWARELGLPVRDVIQAVEDAGLNLRPKSPSGSGDP
jgi:uncharacterized protein (TIGR00299 family) protein